MPDNHIKNYLSFFGFDESSFIPCEYCGAKCQDFHHLIPRSKFGSKRKKEQDHPTNVIAVCRNCHNMAHQHREFNEGLKIAHRKYLLKHA